MHSLSFQRLIRAGSRSASDATRAARASADFLVDNESLLSLLAKSDGGHSDFMGCFVEGFGEQNQRKRDQLAGALQFDTEEGRYLLYICPECGDIGCGAYAAKVRINGLAAEWYDFAYENGYEPARALPSVGPFQFSLVEYVAALEAASAA